MYGVRCSVGCFIVRWEMREKEGPFEDLVDLVVALFPSMGELWNVGREEGCLRNMENLGDHGNVGRFTFFVSFFLSPSLKH